MSKDRAFDNPTNAFFFNVFQMEVRACVSSHVGSEPSLQISRMKYLLASYLRTRLWKVPRLPDGPACLPARTSPVTDREGLHVALGRAESRAERATLGA